MHELPLVFFTVFSQTAIGAFLLLLIDHLVRKTDNRAFAIGLLLSLCVFALGLLASFFHLGQPLRAANTLAGIGRSPMSNEIICSSLFALTGGIAALGLLIFKGKKVALFKTFAVISAILGVIVLFIIPSIYKLDTVTTWKTSFTAFNFIVTAFICGSLLAAILGATRIGLIISSCAILMSLASKPLYLLSLQGNDIASLVAEQKCGFALQTLLLIIGLVLALWALTKTDKKRIIIISFIVVLLAELIGRITFYNLWHIPM